MKKSTLIIIIVCAVVLVGAIVGTSLAIWLPRPSADSNVDVDTDKVNPSEKHIKYIALDSSGVPTDGEAYSYAAVGYDGLVEELIIPSKHNDKDVTHILIDNELAVGDDGKFIDDDGKFIDERFSGSPVISRIVIPSTVIYIASGVFANIPNLTKVTIEGSGAITIDSGAFAGCTMLTAFDCSRTITGDRTSYLFGTPLQNN